jgi:hypothetical protein
MTPDIARRSSEYRVKSGTTERRKRHEHALATREQASRRAEKYLFAAGAPGASQKKNAGRRANCHAR